MISRSCLAQDEITSLVNATSPDEVKKQPIEDKSKSDSAKPPLPTIEPPVEPDDKEEPAEENTDKADSVPDVEASAKTAPVEEEAKSEPAKPPAENTPVVEPPVEPDDKEEPAEENTDKADSVPDVEASAKTAPVEEEAKSEPAKPPAENTPITPVVEPPVEPDDNKDPAKEIPSSDSNKAVDKSKLEPQAAAVPRTGPESKPQLEPRVIPKLTPKVLPPASSNKEQLNGEIKVNVETINESSDSPPSSNAIGTTQEPGNPNSFELKDIPKEALWIGGAFLLLIFYLLAARKKILAKPFIQEKASSTDPSITAWNWAPVPGATAYEVVLDSQPKGKQPSTEFSAKELDVGPHTLRVRAIGSGKSSEWGGHTLEIKSTGDRILETDEKGTEAEKDQKEFITKGTDRTKREHPMICPADGYTPMVEVDILGEKIDVSPNGAWFDKGELIALLHRHQGNDLLHKIAEGISGNLGDVEDAVEREKLIQETRRLVNNLWDNYIHSTDDNTRSFLKKRINIGESIIRGKKPKEASPTEPTRPALKCPTGSGEVMKESPIGEVMVDVSSAGAWFDKGELVQILKQHPTFFGKLKDFFFGSPQPQTPPTDVEKEIERQRAILAKENEIRERKRELDVQNEKLRGTLSMTPEQRIEFVKATTDLETQIRKLENELNNLRNPPPS